MAADQTTANAFDAELNSIQAAIVNDQNTYQIYTSDVATWNTTVNTQSALVTRETWAVDGLSFSEAVAWTLSAATGLASALAGGVADTVLGIPVVEVVAAEDKDIINVDAQVENVAAGILSLAAASTQFEATADGLTLSTDEGKLSTYSQDQAQAYAQWQADLDTETAVAAAFNVAEQAATSESITAQQDEAVAQADSALVQAAAIQQAQTSGAIATATAQPLNVNGGPLTITGEPPSGTSATNLTISSPISLGYSISSITANGSAWTITTSAATGFTQGQSVTISGVTPAAYDGTWTVQNAPTPTAPDTFTIAATANPGSTSGGSVAAVLAGATIDGNGSPVTVSANFRPRPGRSAGAFVVSPGTRCGRRAGRELRRDHPVPGFVGFAQCGR